MGPKNDLNVPEKVLKIYTEIKERRLYSMTKNLCRNISFFLVDN